MPRNDIMKKNKRSNMDKAARDNRANQLNPNNPAYWTSRGYVIADEEDDEDEDRWPGRSSARTARRSYVQARSEVVILRALTHRISADIPVVLPVHEGPYLSRMQETRMGEER